MPLLRKKLFEKQSVPDFLRDDEEVFYCEITNEIFRDYQEFSERMFLCNSMVWTCAMTGKQNLTYQEALESEEHARQSLKEFPNEMKIPILFLAMHTKRTSFGEMAEDVFLYAKDRYFIGENLEACFTTNKWKDCHILSVIAPTEEKLKSSPKNVENGERHFFPPANLYKYEIEHLDAEDALISEIMIVDSTQLKRKRVHFSKDRCKLFLKQYVEQDDRGVFVIKPSVLEQFGVKRTKWDQISNGPLPNFDSSKRFEKALNGKKKARQETMAKYLKKNGTANHVEKGKTEESKDDEKKNNNLLEQMRKRQEEFELMKQLNEVEKLALREKKKKEAKQLSQYIKDWWKPKEDLDLENQVKLPIPTPVKSKIDSKYFGDVLMIMEFVYTFSKILSPKDFFPSGFTFDVFERALTEKEVAGPLTDIIQMFLTAIFKLQEEESTQYSIDVAKDVTEEDLSSNNFKSGVYLATKAATWSKQYQGIALGRLPMYTLTISEILRLHLLSSGARINENGTRYRYSERGGYLNEDDPGLYLRLHCPHILKALSLYNLVELPIADKLKVISCLVEQLLTYADLRDIIEEQTEKVKIAKAELKLARQAERKRHNVFLATKFQLQKELKGDRAALSEKLQILIAENEIQQAENTRKIHKLQKECNNGQAVMGLDRAYRKYLFIRSVPAIFVNWEDEFDRTCKDQVTVQCPHLVDADRKQLLDHMRKLHFVPKPASPGSPKKLNGLRKSLSNEEKNNYAELLLCSADPNTCIVHSSTMNRQRWSFFAKPEELKDLIKCLNKRGIRESELRDVLCCEEENLLSIISVTPVHQLNIDIKAEETEEEQRLKNSKKIKSKYEDPNLGYPPEFKPEDVLHHALMDNILEMEEKIWSGNLGGLKIKDREGWRNALQKQSYDEFQKIIKSDKLLQTKLNNKGEYLDPGRGLGDGGDGGLEGSDSDSGLVLRHSDNTKNAVYYLAVALAQVAESVDPKYLKKPLGNIGNTKHKEVANVISKWEQSLLSSSSFSQIFLHYGTLDSCIMWSRSALLARCRVCRRQKDSENMILCDLCNMGHHLYCLKPKLTSVPKGDWFCNKCKLQKEKEQKLLNPDPPTPQKKRRIFLEEELEEEEESDDEEDSEDSEDSEESIEEIVFETCKTCGAGGHMVTCDRCAANFHKNCCEPPLRRLPRGPWTCTDCKGGRISRHHDSSDYGGVNSQRRCAAKANHRIHAYVKTLRDVDNIDLESDTDYSDLTESSDDSDDLSCNKRSLRRDDCRDDLPLHNAALQELLSDVMKHPDAWPFIRPVQKNEVPDYYNIIKTPMDFGTIKYKLNMGEYSEDSQLMDDVIIVFDNCNTYNRSDDEVYKCGVNLLKHFAKKAKELGLHVPPELEEEDQQPRSKKRRVK